MRSLISKYFILTILFLYLKVPAFSQNGSLPCNKDVKCQDYYGLWNESVKYSAVKIKTYGVSFENSGSGVIINSLINPDEVYILSAFHVFDPDDTKILDISIVNSAEVWFDYEQNTCGGTYITPSTYDPAKIKVGLEEVAYDVSRDFILCKVNFDMPEKYYKSKIDYTCFDDRDLQWTDGALIHHPKGDTKKLSKIPFIGIVSSVVDETYKTLEFQFNKVLMGQDNFDDNGVAEFGSSGGGVFDRDGYLVGIQRALDQIMTCEGNEEDAFAYDGRFTKVYALPISEIWDDIKEYIGQIGQNKTATECSWGVIPGEMIDGLTNTYPTLEYFNSNIENGKVELGGTVNYEFKLTGPITDDHKVRLMFGDGTSMQWNNYEVGAPVGDIYTISHQYEISNYNHVWLEIERGWTGIYEIPCTSLLVGEESNNYSPDCYYTPLINGNENTHVYIEPDYPYDIVTIEARSNYGCGFDPWGVYKWEKKSASGIWINLEKLTGSVLLNNPWQKTMDYSSRDYGEYRIVFKLENDALFQFLTASTVERTRYITYGECADTNNDDIAINNSNYSTQNNLIWKRNIIAGGVTIDKPFTMWLAKEEIIMLPETNIAYGIDFSGIIKNCSTISYKSNLSSSDTINKLDTNSSFFYVRDFGWVNEEVSDPEVLESENFNVTNKKSDETVLIFPNPTSNYFQVQGSKINEIRVINILGEEKILRKVTNNNSIVKFDVTGFNAGMYFVMVKFSDNSTFNQNIIIQ